VSRPRVLTLLADELSGALYWLTKLSDNYNFDLLDSLEKLMDENEFKYPVGRVKGRSVNYTEL